MTGFSGPGNPSHESGRLRIMILLIYEVDGDRITYEPDSEDADYPVPLPGDSGGPLFCQHPKEPSNENERFILIGNHKNNNEMDRNENKAIFTPMYGETICEQTGACWTKL